MKTTDEIKLLPEELPNIVELLPCPFCNGKRIIKGERYFAMCIDCGATGPERIGDKAGISKLFKDWNTRATPDVSELVEALRKCSVGSCNCMTKSPDPQYHAEQCQYKMIAEALAKFRNLQ